VVELARRRAEARVARDFAAADRIRDEAAEAGWVIADRRDGFELSRRDPEADWYHDYPSVPTLLGEPDRCRHSLCVAHYGWPDDLAVLLERVLDSAAGEMGAVELVVALAAGTEAPPPGRLTLDHPALSRPPIVVRAGTGLGHAEALNVAARRARGEFVHFVEPSLRLEWPVLELAAATLADPLVGACGPFGLVTDDWREFRPTRTAEVMALEYLVSVRRTDIKVIGEMDAGFRFYRNLDIDYSRQVVAAGLALRRYQAVVERGVHRVWESTSEAERERLSRRNFNRLLDRWVRGAASGS
jgi:hypothetical protein